MQIAFPMNLEGKFYLRRDKQTDNQQACEGSEDLPSNSLRSMVDAKIAILPGTADQT